MKVVVPMLRTFHPFPKGLARGLPVNTMVGDLPGHRVLVAFDGEPERGRFWIATPAALVALKEMAFGRTSATTGEPVDRDFSDAAVLLERLGGEIAADVPEISVMRRRVVRAAQRLLDDSATAAAARELVRTGQHDNLRAAEVAVRRAASRFLQRLDTDTNDRAE